MVSLGAAGANYYWIWRWNTKTDPSSILREELINSPCIAKRTLPVGLCGNVRANVRAFARKKPGKRSPRDLKSSEDVTVRSDDKNKLKGTVSEDGDLVQNKSSSSSNNNGVSVTVQSRVTVLKACTLTSVLIAALGFIIREVSHVASASGWPIIDCSTEVSFGFQMWHLELISGIIILVSSSRYLLIKAWPDFAESNDAANKQVLSSLEPLDYIAVAFLPGVSEELLFRGGLLPLFGFDWKSALVVAAIFGILHLGSGRKYSFVIWATFIGFIYGYATILSSSILVPMASHAMNNLVGGILWRSNVTSSKWKSYL